MQVNYLLDRVKMKDESQKLILINEIKMNDYYHRNQTMPERFDCIKQYEIA